MTRRDGGTWDPATGVGVTATFGAATRAVASKKGLINDPFAEPLARRWSGDAGDAANNPRYVTATRV